MILVQILALLLIVGFIGMSLWLLTRGYRPARFFLLAFGIFYAGVIISFLRNLGWVPFNFWTGHASAIGAFLHMLLMSLRLNLRYNGLRRDKEMAQSEMVRAVRQLNDGLEHQVAKRTVALQQEIARRELLELELRDALEVERRTREEQKDFVAMVSHEFRTPVSRLRKATRNNPLSHSCLNAMACLTPRSWQPADTLRRSSGRRYQQKNQAGFVALRLRLATIPCRTRIAAAMLAMIVARAHAATHPAPHRSAPRGRRPRAGMQRCRSPF